MTARYAPWSARSWLIVALIVAPYVIVRETLGITYPSWVQWICMAVPLLAGVSLLISPDLAAMKNLTLARLLGAVLVMAAALGAYQLMQISPE